ncbi:tRNA (N6-isopentenyl adenosine(37)-C2)-methylthiotransferase MiaB [Roseisolibacter sp. H3M3-2]|uniref:tRNA (N6-isopentenyl adenosine(37)-C2)-methylthiotransferase MiaB n=1 Tax=Roseisolibacter sp. H3M3-2 TaxID=3031323 RepID=UPI0023DB0BF6|nr:tRNA (N6-isopentenyl adenosine(37)-C2)-methylthiotransferase MiaB [Roseisolibacter sp. H3M3-2]MDF1503028.1 tRNA (N6-isopentenyl adenosine(37)-C2)-methylthiotransferase MiaB [Roseisolibacter sp. H3M3-2]
MSRPTVYIETYGCQMNVSDSELMYGSLAAHGYEAVDTPDGADVILVNTCAIRDHAEQRVLGRLGELRRHMKKGTVMGVAGCMAQRLGPTLLEKARHVSLVVGPDGYRALPQLLEGARSGERTTATSFDLEEHYEDFAPRRFDKVKAWIPVQRGCDYRCTYCIVPYTRGAERSRRLDDVVREVEQVVRDGMSEVVLLGQTVNSYDDGTHDFATLLRAVGRVDGVRRIRFTSPHPNDFSDAVIAAMAEVPQVCEHVHLPMQSGSSRVLKRMLRRYTREGYRDCVARLRAAIPSLNLTTDVIVGFPGETDADFEETLSLVQEIGYEDAYTFKFSLREGTPAERMRPEEFVADEVASERLDRLIAVVRGGARERNLRLLGTRHEVLVEKAARRGEMLQGRTRDFKTVMLPPDGVAIGEYHTVELTGTTGSTFTGAVVRDVPARRPLPVAGAPAPAR